jgi:hypothetical protein
MSSSFRRFKSSLFSGAFALALASRLLVADCEAAVQQRFDVLETSLVTYSNVLVTDITPERIFIRHAGGIGAVKVGDLSADTRQKLGLLLEVKKSSSLVAVPATDVKAAASAGAPKKSFSSAKETNDVSRVQGLGNSWQQFRAGFIAAMSDEYANTERKRPSSMKVLATRAGISMGIYLLHCLILYRVCQKANDEGSLLVFLPGLRWFPLFRAANMSAQLLLVWLIFFVSIICPPPMKAPGAFMAYLCFVVMMFLASAVLYGTWCFKICKELNHSAWVGLFVLFPLTYFPAMIYLARSKRSEKSVTDPRGLAVAA